MKAFRNNAQRLGAGLMSSGIALVTVGPVKAVFWIGFAFLVLGPILLCVTPAKRRRRKPATPLDRK